ncbi:uncharacterized protein MJAP1_000003 [Malassezia japonica]|uniref:Fungal lipase-type domain-containing protein n=1 Tax=Malassezia japonica TaxID=223818 RepID=A0AAF0J7W2_9BASI|nr:uncharacterized protein MJAP1_000003 [Malassezia japonica]WFD37062.1 hypothetical protein MJAP1_000003 [Malassezia japonica]
MRVASLILASLAVVYAAPTQAPTSHKPGKSLPVDWKLLSQAAGLSQQTYCFFQPDNQTVGDAQLLYEYGDGNLDQRAIVFKSKSLGIAVSFEGTEPISIASILHDADFQLVNPDKDLKEVFPPGVQVFKGFQDAYLAVARPVLGKVKEMMQKYNETRVTVTGHSLGAAMALLAAAHYEQTLKDGSVANVFTFGQPRTGNPAFANAMDDKFLGKLFYVVNGQDWVPHMPPRDWNFQHPSGQVWINPPNSQNWTFFPGQEDSNGANSVDPIWTFQDHHGYYFHTGLGHGPGKCPATVNDHE